MKKVIFALVVAGAMIAPGQGFAQTPAPAASGAPAADCLPLKMVSSIKMKRLDDGRHLVPVAINDSPLFLLLDTGGMNALFKEAVDDLKLETHRSNTYIVGVNGVQSNLTAELETMRLGQLMFSGGGIFKVLPGGNTNYPNDKWGGLLGAYLLSRYDVEMDFANSMLNLFSQNHCDGHVVYWKTDNAVAIPVEYPANGRARLPVKLDGVEIRAELDTGAVDIALNRGMAVSKLKFDPKAPDVQVFGSGNNAVYRKRFKTLELQGVIVNNPLVTILPERGLNYFLLGSSVLNKLHLYFAYKEKKLYVSPADITEPQSVAATPPAPLPAALEQSKAP